MIIEPSEQRRHIHICDVCHTTVSTDCGCAGRQRVNICDVCATPDRLRETLLRILERVEALERAPRTLTKLQ